MAALSLSFPAESRNPAYEPLSTESWILDFRRGDERELQMSRASPRMTHFIRHGGIIIIVIPAKAGIQLMSL
jgi:hypothetical protein